MKLISFLISVCVGLGVLNPNQSCFAIAQEHIIKVDGSSTVFPITEAVAEEFQSSKKGAVRVTVGISGTGGGFKKFCRGETDIQDASRPITKEEIEVCTKAGIRYYELPVAYDAMTIVVNPKNTWVTTLHIDDLKKIWKPQAQGKITKWNQVHPEWPNATLKLFGAGSDSGTFDYFTEVIVGKAKSSRGDYTASEDDNTLVLGVSNDLYALGYIPFSYYELNKSKLKALAIASFKKEAILPSRKTVVDGTYAPLSRPIFIYVNAAAASKPEVKEFVEFYLNHGEKLTSQVQGVPLSSKAYALALNRFHRGKTGTVFFGESKAGLKIEDLLK